MLRGHDIIIICVNYYLRLIITQIIIIFSSVPAAVQRRFARNAAHVAVRDALQAVGGPTALIRIFGFSKSECTLKAPDLILTSISRSFLLCAMWVCRHIKKKVTL